MIGRVLEEMQPCPVLPCLGAQSPSAKHIGRCFVILLYKTCDSLDYIIDVGFCACSKRTYMCEICCDIIGVGVEVWI